MLPAAKVHRRTLLPSALPPRIGRRSAGLWSLGASLGLHASAAFAVLTVGPTVSREPSAAEVVEIELRQPPPPPPPVVVEEPPAPVEVVEPAPRPRRRVPPPPQVPAPEPAPPPPPPNRTTATPPSEAPPAPSFGVTADSVVDGESTVSVPVGNTLMTDELSAPPVADPQPLAPAGPPPFAPVGDSYLGEFARTLRQVKAPFPPEAYRLGIGGQVKLRVGISRTGKVYSVHVVKAAGHGFDEAAKRALEQFKFSPCRDKAGQAVDCLITYTYTFEEPGF